jgi:uncharacterized protein (DUF342 family)
VDNPLTKLIAVEERPDGVYVKVDRERRNAVSREKILQKLEEANVINYNAGEIERVLQRARGAFEKIGPLFQYYPDQLDSLIKVAVKPLSAAITCDPLIAAEHIDVTEDILRVRLTRAGVAYGIRDDVLRELVREPRYDEEIVVAQGCEPRDGADAKIDMLVEINPSVHFTPDRSGKVNYRDIQTFVSVKEGQPIARKYPPTEGEPGKTVTGEALAPKPGKDIPLPRGKNTEVSDGNELIAAKTGVVYRDGQSVHVEELLDVAGDVDFSVGNVKYSGSVVIRGNVLPGFAVETEGNIIISGQVESARVISRQGSVEIHGGVIGKGDTHIFGRTSVSIAFAQEAQIRTDGVLSIERYALHCHMVCDTLESPHGNVVGGDLRAYVCAEAHDLGNEKHVKTAVTIINKIRAQGEAKISELKDLRQKIAAQLESVNRELRTKSSIIKKAGAAITDRHRAELKKTVDAYNTLSMKTKYVDKKIAGIQEAIDTPATYDGYVRVRGCAWPGVTVDLYGMGKKQVTAPMSDKSFKLQQGVIQEEG